MDAIKIINHSTLTDCSTVMRVGRLLAGDEYDATHDEQGNIVVVIKKPRKNTYLVLDAGEIGS